MHERTMDIPPPERPPSLAKTPGSPGRPAIYPFAELRVGESVFLPGKRAAKVSSSLQHVVRKQGFRFTTRQEESGLRVWRIA
jgi:hypothetical protein